MAPSLNSLVYFFLLSPMSIAYPLKIRLNIVS